MAEPHAHSQPIQTYGPAPHNRNIWPHNSRATVLCLRFWPILLSVLVAVVYPLLLVLIIVNRDLSSSTSFNTSFDLCSVQLIFSILRHTSISKVSNLVMYSFLIVLISAQDKVTLQISVFTVLFLRHLQSSQSNP